MEFEVSLYEEAASPGQSGAVPMAEFLDDLQANKPIVYKLMLDGLARLEIGARHGPPHTELVDPEHDIFELRVGRRDIARAFFFFRRGRRIIVTNGYVKKQQKLDVRELDRARRYKRDWEERHPDER